MHYRHTPISPNFDQGVEAAGPVSPINGSNHKVSTFVPILLDCSGLLPIPGHVIGINQRHRRGRGVRRFGAKETQPMVTNVIYQTIIHSFESVRKERTS